MSLILIRKSRYLHTFEVFTVLFNGIMPQIICQCYRPFVHLFAINQIGKLISENEYKFEKEGTSTHPLSEET